MKFSFEKWLLLSLVVFVAGCGSVPDVAPPELVQRMRKVAVVSTVGDVFVRTYVGATAFGNEVSERRVPDWGLDAAYERQLGEALARLGGVTVVKAPHDAAAFAAVNPVGGGLPQWALLASTTRQHCSAHGLDGVVVLAKWGRHGVGVAARRGGPGRGSHLSLTAQLGLYDCRTGQLAAARPLEERLPPGRSGTAGQVPRMPTPDEWPWYGPWEAEVYEKARAELLRLPQKAWGDTVRLIWTGAR
jgi:hypothetical protein